MANAWLEYLKKEHASIDEQIRQQASMRCPDALEISRLKKLKLAIKDQIAAWHHDLQRETVA